MDNKNNNINKTNNKPFSIIPGLSSGVVIACLFNPWDRALYLSSTNNRPFLDKTNFINPYQGFRQVGVQRVISSGLYFTLQDSINYNLSKHFTTNNFISKYTNSITGITAGCLNGFILNSLNSVKFQMWNCNKATYIGTVKKMYETGGVKIFMRGAGVTMCRDAMFGVVYETTRNKLDKNNMFCNMFAASLATSISSPVNYVRNVRYATLMHESQKTSGDIIKDLFTGLDYSSMYRKLGLGWGTLRVGVGMGLGQTVYNGVQKWLN